MVASTVGYQAVRSRILFVDTLIDGEDRGGLGCS
jgi:hypothetical protein